LLRYARRWGPPQSIGRPKSEASDLFPAIIGGLLFLIYIFKCRFESISDMEEVNLFPYGDMSITASSFVGIRYSHLPLHNFLLKCLSYFQMDPGFFRLLSGLAFGAAIIYFHRLCGLFMGRRARVWATIVFACSPILQYYAMAIETYAVLLLAATAFLYQAAMILMGKQTRIRYALFWGIIGELSHAFFMLFLAAVALALLITLFRKISEEYESAARPLIRLYAWLTVGVIPTLCMILFFITHVFQFSAFRNVQLNMYLPLHHMLLTDSLIDIWNFLGLQLSVGGVTWVKVCGGLYFVLLALATLGSFRRKAAFFSAILTIISLLMMILGARFVNGVMDVRVNGVYHYYRHLITFVPVFLCLIGIFFDRLEQRGKHLTILYIAAAAVIAIQLPSAARIIFDRQNPDARAAWEYIESRLEPNDAIVATPVSAILLPTVSFYELGFERMQGNRTTQGEYTLYGYSPFWGSVDGRDLLWYVDDVALPYDQWQRHPFIERIWEVQIDSRLYGLYPELNHEGIARFAQGFAGWKVLHEQRFAYLVVRLLDAPPVCPISDAALRITAGENDLYYLRKTVQEVCYPARQRMLLSESELFLPRSLAGAPQQLTIYPPDDEPPLDASLGCVVKQSLPVDAPILPCRTRDDGYLIELGGFAGYFYEKIEVRYAGPDQ
ncbi:MAG: hypothetical protein P9M14_06260, partial [Candidatus Alcyoniella australis]|nr:hypothetical protein [Candidatus Alcyoniella australis]